MMQQPRQPQQCVPGMSGQDGGFPRASREPTGKRNGTQREEKATRTQSTKEERVRAKAKEIKDGEDQDKEEEKARGKDSKEGAGYATKSGTVRTNARREQERMDQGKEERRTKEEKESKDNVGTVARRGMRKLTAPIGEKVKQSEALMRDPKSSPRRKGP